MICFNCGCRLSEKDFCTGCGIEVGMFKKIMYTANRYYNDGLDKAGVRDLSGAILSLRQCLKLNKNHIEARNLLGLIYFERGEVVAALSEWVISKNIRSEKNIADDYIDMIQNNPGRLEAFNQTIKKYNLALNYCQQDSLDLAVIQLKKIISMNSHFIQARQLLALLYINSQEWEKAKKELEKALKIDTNNTTTLRYLKEVNEMMPPDEEKGKKRKDAIVYQSGNETVIQPVTKKEMAGFQTLMNIVIGLVIGIGITYFLIVPSKVQEARSDGDKKYQVVSEQLDAKTVEVNELNALIEEIKAENSALSDNLNSAQGNNTVITANTSLIEAATMFINNTGDEMDIAESLELIDVSYVENEATESFKNLYTTLKENIAQVVAEKSHDLGYEAFRGEDYSTAIKELERSFGYDSSNGEVLFKLANAYNKSGDTRKAIEVYEQVIELFPDTDKAKKSQNYIKEILGD